MNTISKQELEPVFYNRKGERNKFIFNIRKHVNWRRLNSMFKDNEPLKRLNEQQRMEYMRFLVVYYNSKINDVDSLLFVLNEDPTITSDFFNTFIFNLNDSKTLLKQEVIEDVVNTIKENNLIEEFLMDGKLLEKKYSNKSDRTNIALGLI